MFVIDWKTGQRKLTQKGPTLGQGAMEIMEEDIDKLEPPILQHSALKRVDTTMPFPQAPEYSDPSWPSDHNMFENYK